MQIDLRQNNNIIVFGKIVSDCSFSHQIYGESFYTFKLETSRFSDTVDILPIMISERLIDKKLLKIGNFVEIKGQLRSYNNIVENKNYLVLTIFTKEINFKEKGKVSNEVVLNGFLCKNAVYRKTPLGREITDILLAVNRSYNKSDYIPCIIWGRNAGFASSLNVGQNIIVTGRMQSRNYQKKLENGKVIEKIAYEVSVSKLEILKTERIKYEN